MGILLVLGLRTIVSHGTSGGFVFRLPKNLQVKRKKRKANLGMVSYSEKQIPTTK